MDGQDFADIEAYGVQRWLGELALALREETYRPDPISSHELSARYFIRRDPHRGCVASCSPR